MSGGFTPTDADLQLSELELTLKLQNYPRTVLRLAQLIAELQQNSSSAKKIARKLRGVETPE